MNEAGEEAIKSIANLAFGVRALGLPPLPGCRSTGSPVPEVGSSLFSNRCGSR